MPGDTQIRGSNHPSEPFGAYKITVPLGDMYGLRLKHTAFTGQQIQTWDNGEAMSYSNWETGEPADLFMDKFNCAKHFLPWVPNGGFWTPFQCFHGASLLCRLNKNSEGNVPILESRQK